MSVILSISRSRFMLLLLVTLIALGTGARQVQAEVQVGGLNLEGYCQNHYWGGQAVLVSPRNAYSWRCYSMGWLYEIDTNAVCRWDWGYNAYARTYNWSDPYSWKCYKP